MIALVHPWRAELVDALIPAPGGDLPALAALERDDFWIRFDETAPGHLQLGLTAASLVLVTLLPRLLGHPRSLGRLDQPARDRVLALAGRWPGTRDLLDVAKIVACFAYFDHPAIQAAVRGTAS